MSNNVILYIENERSGVRARIGITQTWDRLDELLKSFR